MRKSASEDGNRYAQVTLVAAIQLCSGLLIGLILLDRRAHPGFDSVLIMAGPLGSAAMLSSAALLFIPHLLPGGRVAFPTNVSLPIVFALLVRASTILWTSPQSAAFRTADPLLPALLWTKWTALAWLAGTQVVLFSMWTAKRSVSN